MIRDFVWRMFEETGNIDNYMLFKDIEFKKSTNSKIENEVLQLDSSK